MLSYFSLATPWALLGILLIPILIYAYLKRKDSSRLPVPSIFILKQLSKKFEVKKKFTPPLRFFLELLALLLLVFSASDPRIDEPGLDIAILLDNSLSMSARSAEGIPGETRFEAAKKRALDIITEAGPQARFSLFQTSPRLKLSSVELGSAGELKSALNTLSLSPSTDNLESAVNEIQEQGKYKRLEIISDYLSEAEPKAASAEQAVSLLLKNPPAESSRQYTEVKLNSVFKASTNAWISDFSIVEGGELLTNVSYNGLSNAEAVLSYAELLTAEQSEAKEVYRSKVNLQADKANSFRLKLADISSALSSNEDSQRKRVYRVTLQLNNPGLDSIAEDNQAWLSLNKPKKNAIALIEAETPRSSLGLELLAEVRGFSLSEFAALKSEQQLEFALLIFHKVVPVKVPQQNSLYILPPAGNKLFPVAKELSPARITSWKNEHPVLSYLKVPLLELSAAQTFRLPIWAIGILQAEQGPLLAVAESKGVRLAAVGFELLPFEAARTPSLSILLLNLFRWLSAELRQAESLSTASLYQAEPSVKLIRKPDGSSESMEPANSAKTMVLEKPGVYYLLKNSRPNAIPGEKEQTEALVVNSFFPEESNTNSAKTLNFAASVVEQTNSKVKSQIWWLLAAMALSLVLAEPLLTKYLPERALFFKQKRAS